MDMKILAVLMVVASIVLIAGCVGQDTSGLNPWDRYNQAQQGLEEHYKQERNITFQVEVEYAEINSGVPEIGLYLDGKLKTRLKLHVTADSNVTTSMSITMRDTNTGWDNLPSSDGRRNFRGNDTFYILKYYEIPELGYTPELEICIDQFIRDDIDDGHRTQCFIKTLPPANLNVEISPSSVEVQLEPRETKEVPVTISNSGIFLVNTLSFNNFEEPEDPEKRVHFSIKTDATSLKPGQSAPAIIKVISLTSEPFEFSGQLFYVEFRDNLGNYLYRKPFTIVVKQS